MWGNSDVPSPMGGHHLSPRSGRKPQAVRMSIVWLVREGTSEGKAWGKNRFCSGSFSLPEGFVFVCQGTWVRPKSNQYYFRASSKNFSPLMSRYLNRTMLFVWGVWTGKVFTCVSVTYSLDSGEKFSLWYCPCTVTSRGHQWGWTAPLEL